MADETEKDTIIVSLGSDPALQDAFRTLLGERQPPPGTDRDAYLRYCVVVLQDAIDRFETRRTGKPVFWPFPRLGNTTSHEPISQDTQTTIYPLPTP